MFSHPNECDRCISLRADEVVIVRPNYEHLFPGLTVILMHPDSLKKMNFKSFSYVPVSELDLKYFQLCFFCSIPQGVK